MINEIIKIKTNQWLSSKDCSVKNLISYIREKGELRDTQIEAIEVYLFLKIKGQNKPLWQLFSEGFFANDTDHSTLNINNKARTFLAKNINASALYDFARQEVGKTTLLPNLEKMIRNNCDKVEYEKIIKNIFYNVSYTDYLMSLPMGAGKTYLMAAFIYIDLYFASNEPENKNFSHNFLVLIPSGLKTSIGPSLKTIENFDPSWVIPEPAAANLKKQLIFDVLDEPKSAKKSNKSRSPNAQKVNQCLPNPFGQVFVVNAEKVILNRVDTPEQKSIFEDDEDKKANELRNLLSKIPNLSILIDEVHHAASSDIKLRKVVNGWNEKGNITTVLGFSGTPYLSSTEKIQLSENEHLRISEITNTVYYYPLTTAIKNFLKTPTVKIGENLDHFQIVKKGIEDFNKAYGKTIYENGAIAKVAIYCSTIEMLENEIYPYLQGELNIKADEILRFHGGNKTYSLPKENELQFKSLDTSLSKKKYILLVAIGKEGWDCQSLTSVILPQKSKSTSKNSIIQTTCRCLRQVTKGNNETALVWLNKENAEILNKQLKKEQDTSIEELNSITRASNTKMVKRVSRMGFLKVPKVDYYQLKVSYNSIEEEKSANTKEKLIELSRTLEEYKCNALITTTGLEHLEAGELEFLENLGKDLANYNAWIFNIAKDSFDTITITALHSFDKELKAIFEKVTFEKNEQRFFNEQFDLFKINSKIRVAFSVRKSLKTKQEIIPKEANLLIIDNLKPVEQNKNIFPDKEISKQLLSFDKEPLSKAEFDKQKQDRILQLTQEGEFKEIAKIASETIHPIIEQKDKSFHLLPYNFDSSFESDILNQTIRLKDFKEKKLEMYFNGERGLTEFVINCFAKKGKNWHNIGKYTSDFLILNRTKDNKIHKALIIETKGEGFANDQSFIKKKNFIETNFLEQNNEKFGYQKFDFIYLEDSISLTNNINKLNTKINSLFN